MSLDEVQARILHAIRKRVWRRRRSWVAPYPEAGVTDPWVMPDIHPDNVERIAVIAEAERYLEGRYTFLNLSFHEEKIDWHTDPQTGLSLPVTFGLDLDFKDPSRVGNLKNVWEKNRHHHLTILSLAYALTREERYADEVGDQLNDWINKNSFPNGVNWTSSLEIAIRLISWVWTERLLRGTKAHEELFGTEGLLWSSIYWSQWMIASHYSHGSSANNHLIGEMAGLYIASVKWPVFNESDKWRKLAQGILAKEVTEQTFESGLNKEQAFAYHIFSLEFLLLAGIEGERFGRAFSDDYLKIVSKSIKVIADLSTCSSGIPEYGDADEGMALQLRPLDSSRVSWIYRLGRKWLSGAFPSGEEGSMTSDLLLPGVKDDTDMFKPLAGSVGFSDAGLYALVSNRGKPDEIFLLADAGPHGYLSIAAHGHADALSFTLSAGGVPVIVDPGTYAYHYAPRWRSYFRSALAHNTVTVDGEDQSESGGPFLWKSKANCVVHDFSKSESGATLQAEHDGYTRLESPVAHRRSITLDGQRVKITDEIVGEGERLVEWRLHFHPDIKTDLMGKSLVASFSKGELEISLDERFEWKVVRGGETAGWYSPGFNLKAHCDTLIGTLHGVAPVKVVTSMVVVFD